MSFARRALIVAGLLLGAGCIARHRAPDEPVIATTPYAALALYRQILPPISDGAPLPRTALRLAVGADGAVFADTTLIDGPATARIAESWPDAMALLAARSEPIVVLMSAAPHAELCATLAPLSPRAIRATRTVDEPLHPLKERDPVPDGLSADPLAGHALQDDCPAP